MDVTDQAHRVGAHRRLAGLISCGMLLLVSQSMAATTTAYSFTNLGVIGADHDSNAQAINATGKVVGQSGSQSAYSVTSGNFAAFSTSNTGIANGVNSGGVAVGVYTVGGADTAFYSDGSNGLHAIPDFGGGSGMAMAVTGNSASFQAVGQSKYGGLFGSLRAFSYTSGSSTITPLDPSGSTGLGDTQPGGVSIANGLNSSGSIVGQASSASGDQHAFLYDPGTSKMYDLLTISGSGASAAAAISPGGTIVGVTDVIDSDGEHNHAFLYSGYNVAAISGSSTDQPLNGSFTDLGTLDGSDSAATAINNLGVIVGTAAFSGDQHAFVYQSGSLQDLNGLTSLPDGWVLNSATGINDLGAIAGTATYTNPSSGDVHTEGFLLNPSSVPEPTAIGSAIVAGAGVLLKRRRKTEAAVAMGRSHPDHAE